MKPMNKPFFKIKQFLDILNGTLSRTNKAMQSQSSFLFCKMMRNFSLRFDQIIRFSHFFF